MDEEWGQPEATPLRSVLRQCVEKLKQEYPNLSELTIVVDSPGGVWEVRATMFASVEEFDL